MGEFLSDGEGLGFMGEAPSVDTGGMRERLALHQPSPLEVGDDFAGSAGRQMSQAGDLGQGERHGPAAISQIDQGDKKGDLFQSQKMPEGANKDAGQGQEASGRFFRDLRVKSLDVLHGSCLSWVRVQDSSCS
jgi:hypothetical protein